MVDQETAMLTYARLARISHEKRQQLGGHRFLLLAGAAACRAGWLDVAERCREIIAGQNPRHFLARCSTFADAMRDADHAGYFERLERFCSFEQAEYLVAQNGGPIVVPADITAGAAVLEELQPINAAGD